MQIIKDPTLLRNEIKKLNSKVHKLALYQPWGTYIKGT